MSGINKFKKIILVYMVCIVLPIITQAQDMSRYRDIEPLFEGIGHFPGARFGRTIAGIGDQNGDGYNDILVGAEGELRAYLFYGGNPMDTIPDMIFRPTSPNFDIFGYRVASAGDVNGDGFTDFLIGEGELGGLAQIKLYFGGELLDTIPDLKLSEGDIKDGFGSNFRSAGDVNGDGYDDFLISSSNFADPLLLGRVHLYFGGVDLDSIADWVETGDTALSYLGRGSLGGGDVNGDGYDDILLGGWRVIRNEETAVAYSYINMYFGGPSLDTIPSMIIDERYTEFTFRSSAKYVGDLNGDFIEDFATPVRVTPPPVDTTWVWIFHGGNPPDNSPILALTGLGGGIDRCLCNIKHAGDINGDGYGDIIVGDPGGWNSLGQVLVYLGGPNMDGKFDIGFTGFLTPVAGAGIAIDWVGDVNGDGIDDIFFGAHEGFFNPEGRAVIYSGDSTLVSVREKQDAALLPQSPILKQNYPNPFNPSTNITFELPHKGHVVLMVYDITGKEVTTLLNKVMPEGTHTIEWDGRSDNGSSAPSGLYFVRLKNGDITKTRKIILLR